MIQFYYHFYFILFSILVLTQWNIQGSKNMTPNQFGFTKKGCVINRCNFLTGYVPPKIH